MISIVIPIYNEEENIEELHRRLRKTLDNYSESYEIIYVDDGSKDKSLEILKSLSGNVKIVELARNYGQHAAILAGFSVCKGDKVITLDADLQNPPEEMPNIIKKLEEGYDVVATVRQIRRDSIFRRLPSKINNYFVRKITKIDLKDWGCMYTGYKIKIVRRILNDGEKNVYIPAVAAYYTRNIAEIPIAHNRREKGKSKYSFVKLVNLMFNLWTSFSNAPLEVLLYGGTFLAFFGFVLGIILGVGRIIYGRNWALYSVFSLFSVLFMLIGAQFLAFGVLGEYIGRINRQVKNRPIFVIENMIDKTEKNEENQ